MINSSRIHMLVKSARLVSSTVRPVVMARRNYIASSYPQNTSTLRRPTSASYTSNTKTIQSLSPRIPVRSMFIQTSPTPNDDALKFLPSQRVLPESYGNKTIEFLSGREAHSSPLARKLFAIDGVKSVMLGPDFLTVEKVPTDHTAAASSGDLSGPSSSSEGGAGDGSNTPSGGHSWMLLKPEIFAVLTEHLTAGLPVLIPGTEIAHDTQPNEDDDDVVAMIKELIDTRIRPAIQEDGGDIEYMGFTDDGIVQLKLQGACRSCDSSSVTLKNGIENMLMHYVEEVNGVEQVLDPGEQAALQEFEKFEAKLKNQKGDTAEPETSSSPPPL